MTTIDTARLAVEVSERRKAKGLAQETLAARVGVSRSTVQNMENERWVDPGRRLSAKQTETLHKVVRLLEIALDDLTQEPAQIRGADLTEQEVKEYLVREAAERDVSLMDLLDELGLLTPAPKAESRSRSRHSVNTERDPGG